MRFWDSSAVVPLLVEQSATVRVRRLYREDPSMLVWWATMVECASAVTRLEREGKLAAAGVTAALRRLDRLGGRWQEIQPGEPLREHARRFLRTHPLRAADALQLAAAFVASEHRPPTLAVACLDQRLATAAAREGFEVLGLAAGALRP